MNQEELVASMAVGAGIPKTKALIVYKAIIDTINQQLARGQKVHLADLGTFTAKVYPAKMGYFPRTGDPLLIPAHANVVFSASQSARDV